MYTPIFPCKFCDKEISASVQGDQGVVVLCDCPDAREAWEKEHRATMERRKKARKRK
jgi:hypothetical protein